MYEKMGRALKKGLKKEILRCGLLGRKMICIWEYWRYYKEWPNLKTPVTIGEKIQWIKINYYNPLYVKCADKILVRDYVREKLGEYGEDILPKIYHTYSNASEVRLSDLPKEFVMKPNHSSNKIIICTDKSKLEEKKLLQTIEEWMRENFYYIHGEWQYKTIQPKIICEKLLKEDIVDYRVYCFEGEPKFVRTTKHNKGTGNGYIDNFYDTAWQEIGCALWGGKRRFLLSQ